MVQQAAEHNVHRDKQQTLIPLEAYQNVWLRVLMQHIVILTINALHVQAVTLIIQTQEKHQSINANICVMPGHI